MRLLRMMCLRVWRGEPVPTEVVSSTAKACLPMAHSRSAGTSTVESLQESRLAVFLDGGGVARSISAHKLRPSVRAVSSRRDRTRQLGTT